MAWAKKITDWHEDFSPNHLLAKQMDYHNNAVGRKLFLEQGTIFDENIISILTKMTADSIKVVSLEELKKVPENRMTHIIDFQKTE